MQENTILHNTRVLPKVTKCKHMKEKIKMNILQTRQTRHRSADLLGRGRSLPPHCSQSIIHYLLLPRK